MLLTLTDTKVILLRWGALSRGQALPQRTRCSLANLIRRTETDGREDWLLPDLNPDGDWPADVRLLENALTYIGMQAGGTLWDGPRRLEAIKLEYLSENLSRADKSRILHIRNADYYEYIDETVRKVMDVCNMILQERLQPGTKFDRFSGRIAIAV